MGDGTPVRRIHHINFIYADLEQAVEKFERALKLGPFEYGELSARGVRTARVKLGDTYLVLVSPTSADSEPARFLQKHGEGFFLLSFAVDDLYQALETLVDGDSKMLMAQSRQGLDGWHVVDLPFELQGVTVQLTQDKSS